MKSAKNKQVVLHPIMFALYPVVFLYAGHKALLDFSVVFAPAVVCMLLAGVVWYVLTKLMADWNRAAIATSAFLMALFSYRPIMNGMRGSMDVWSKIIVGCILAAVLCALYALRSSKHLSEINYGMNMASLLLVGGPLLQAAIWNYSMSTFESSIPDRRQFNTSPLQPGTAGGPDIYYLILDGYAREDYLRNEFGFDNSDMIAALEERGFKVAGQAVANYPYTLASVSSSLNFTHLPPVFGEQLVPAGDERFLRSLLKDNRSVRWLKSAGYRIVSFESEYWGANIGDVDDNFREWWFLSAFSARLLQMTVVPPIMQAVGYPLLYDLHAARTEYAFEKMAAAVEISGPKFVYAHMFFAHPPFVFAADGRRVEPVGDYMWDYEASAVGSFEADYVAQVSYLNQRMLTAVDEIIKRSDREPIIIMHGDHGPSRRYDGESLENTDVAERYPIFYAARLPDGGNEDVYDSISPVNAFRIVFNRYFGTNYELLDDRSYFAAQSLPYLYTQLSEVSLHDSRVTSTADVEPYLENTPDFVKRQAP